MTDALTLLVDQMETPIGDLVLVADSAGRLRVMHWTGGWMGRGDGRLGEPTLPHPLVGTALRAVHRNASGGGPVRDDHTSLHRELRRQYGARGYTLAAACDPHGFTTAMRAYFNGDIHVIDGLPVEAGGTTFQREVWGALREIPCGTTMAYSELARRIGRPAAVRAVGLANGSNPVGIVVPCHRVIGANGTLTGYGGGLDRKRWLLAHEARQHTPTLF